MKFFKFLLFAPCLYFSLLLGETSILKTTVKGRHVEIVYTGSNSKFQNISINEENRLNLINQPSNILEKNLELMKRIPGFIGASKIDLDMIWGMLQNFPLMLFNECDDSSLNRILNSKPRHLFEKKVLTEAIKSVNQRKDSNLHLTFFGSNYLFDSLAHLVQILDKKLPISILEIDLVDSIYSEYITFVKENNFKEISTLKFSNKNKEKWFNILTIRFAIFSAILKKLSPDTSITLRIYAGMEDISDDLLNGKINTTSNLVIAGDLFDEGGGTTALHDFAVHGAKITNKGAIMISLIRDEDDWLKKYNIIKVIKLTPAENSRDLIRRVTYSKNDDWFSKMSKRFECISTEFTEPQKE